MVISNISIQNFRIYKDITLIDFDKSSGKNISIIAGKNGFGKTTFLLSLVWCLYGKMVGEVEEKYRKDIKSFGGYENFLKSLINRDLLEDKNSDGNVSVEIEFQKMSIPSIPCHSVLIKRTYNLKNETENLSVLIDGIENELTKDVGYEIFINDFILPREIAKFFFFDAEKIVSLAEANTRAELKDLNKAYSEVLGIKKYEDLKKNLESLLSKLKRSNVSEKEKEKLQILINQKEEKSKTITFLDGQIQELEKELTISRNKSNKLQEQLIREGNEITLEELLQIKEDRETLKTKNIAIKNKLQKLLDIVPLVISGKKLNNLRKQLEFENNTKSNNIDMKKLSEELKIFSSDLIEKLKIITNSTYIEETVYKTLDDYITAKEGLAKESINSDEIVLLDFDNESYRKFFTLYDNILNSFALQFNQIVKEEKDNRIVITRLNQKIKQAESKKDNHFVRKIREEKNELDAKIEKLTQQKENLLIENSVLKNELNSVLRSLSELEKEFQIAGIDEKKHKVTSNLLEKINRIILKVKEDKKYSLQKTLLLGLKKLMHKNNLVSDVRITIDEEIMDIQLLDKKSNTIDKNSLSKGEQQLYATALLKALVEESGIKFPVFIDSPLQKFDKEHSKNVILEFYPYISEQVILLPLIEKELSEIEYELLKPNVNTVYTIQNNLNNSKIDKIKKEDLFLNSLEADVYSN